MSLDGSLAATYRVSDSRHLTETPLPRIRLLVVLAEQPRRPENWQLLMLVETVYLSQGRLVLWHGTWAAELNRSPASCVNPAPNAAPCTNIWWLPKKSLPSQYKPL